MEEKVDEKRNRRARGYGVRARAPARDVTVTIFGPLGSQVSRVLLLDDSFARSVGHWKRPRASAASLRFPFRVLGSFSIARSHTTKITEPVRHCSA